MRKTYDQIEKDMLASFARNNDFIKKQVMLEIIQVAATCETYDEFRKTLYGMALQYLKDFENAGLVPKGTTDSAIKDTQTTGKTVFKKNKKEDK